jgi:20S proteasome alpha/beta subunit
MDETSVQKISLLTDNIGVVYSGMGPGLQRIYDYESY